MGELRGRLGTLLHNRWLVFVAAMWVQAVAGIGYLFGSLSPVIKSSLVSEQYARRSGTYFCVDKGVTAVVIKGLADHRDSVGAPLCPCRHYDDKAAEVAQGFWNCPCVPMRERKECHCMLFLTPDNDFAGTEQAISFEEIKETTSKI